MKNTLVTVGSIITMALGVVSAISVFIVAAVLPELLASVDSSFYNGITPDEFEVILGSYLVLQGIIFLVAGLALGGVSLLVNLDVIKMKKPEVLILIFGIVIIAFVNALAGILMIVGRSQYLNQKKSNSEANPSN